MRQHKIFKELEIKVGPLGKFYFSKKLLNYMLLVGQLYPDIVRNSIKKMHAKTNTYEFSKLKDKWFHD